MKLGLKVWSNNDYYVKPALKLYQEKCYDFIELYAVPGSISKYLRFWKRLDIPYVIHAPHYAHGFNLAEAAKRKRNKLLFKEAQAFADELAAKYIVVHCGVLGSREEAEGQLSDLKDARIVIENKPLCGLDNSICAGSSPEEIRRYKKAAKVSFCFDVNHAAGYAFASGKNHIKVINDFLRLDPVMIHMAGIMNASNGDEHVHLDQSTCDLYEIMELIMKNGKSIELCSLETPKEPGRQLEDFRRDLDFFKSLIGKKSLVLRPAIKDDCKDLWRWRNNRKVRQCCFNSKTIAWEQHRKWFSAKMKDDNARLYIGMHGKDKIGVIRFDAGIDSITVSINIDPAFFNKGFGTAMIRIGTEKAFSEFGDSRPVLAEIKKENISSKKAFEKAGYRHTDESKRGVIYACFYNR